ncbi:DMT family transporter [Mucisphaera sp.]|uniref:DMT family transporter n=1 Tax=Mucisphaera sp. TaxID=2913024 RepID=UPI003D14D7CE
MPWLYLTLAAIFEVIFALAMKQSEGFTRLWPTVVTIIGVIGGISLLTLALKTLPVSVAYPIWVAVGTLGTVVFGVVLFGENLSAVKVLGVVLIIGGVACLKASTLADPEHEPAPQAALAD